MSRASVTTFGHRGTTSSIRTEISRELVNASDGAGLHFDGSGNISFTPVDLGSKFSHEFVIKADEDLTTGSSSYIIDYEGGSGRFVIGAEPTQASGNLAIYDDAGWKSFGVNPLTDLKVHHIVVTVDGTAAVLYDNGNQVGTVTINANHGIDNATAAAIGSNFLTATSNNFEGVIYRARFYNRTLSADDVRTAYERADVDYSSQYGSQTDLTSGSFAGFGSFGTGVSESGGVLTATGGATGNIASKAIGLVANAVYRVQYEILTISGGSGVAMNPSGSGGLTPTRTSTGVYTETMTAPSDASGTINVYTSSSMGAFSGTLGNITVQRVGCVTDYDLAFANPTQSLTVQDRSGAADGTCSASGVTQVQPIIQGNLTSLAVTTSQQAAGVPADGEIVATGVKAETYRSARSDGDVYIQAATASDFVAIGTQDSSNLLKVEGSGKVTVNLEDAGTYLNVGSGNHRQLRFTSYDTVSENAGHKIDASSSNGEMKLATGGTPRLTIDSSGNVGVGVSPNSKLDVHDTANNQRLIRISHPTSPTEASGYLGFASDGTTDNNLVVLGVQYSGSYYDVLSIQRSTRLTTFSNGIAFQSATTGSGTGVGYTLENYEYGTFTMGLSGTTATIPSGNATARYYRIGNLVWVSWYSGSMTLASSSGAAELTGLPFNVAGNTANYSVFSYAHGNAVDGNSHGGYFIASTKTMRFIDAASTGASTFVDGSNRYIMVTGVYETADA